MSVKHAILGILLERPSYPYELSVRFEKTISHAWQLNRGQVYQTVYRLEDEGYVERIDTKPNAHGQKVIYQVSEQGRDEFDRWMSSRSGGVRPLRDDLLVRLALARSEDSDELLNAISRREYLCAERLTEYAEVQESMVPLDRARSWQEAAPALSMNAALAQLNAELTWLATAREMIMRLREQGSVPRRRVETRYERQVAAS